MRRVLRILLGAAAIGLIAGWWLTAPAPAPDAAGFAAPGDPGRGAQVFAAAGCAGCHMAPGAEGADRLVLAGGQPFASDFGTFYAPNISPGPQGIGDWSVTDLAGALLNGVSPDGRHYYPAFPFTSYRNMTAPDISDLYAYIRTLPAADTPSADHGVSFPFNIRRALGAWKWLFFSRNWVRPAPTQQLERGRYLVEGLGHCAECHTPRNLVGGLVTSRWMAGGPNPSGRGSIPALTPDKLTWSDDEVAYFLTTGFTPEFDVAGGEMIEVVENLKALPESDIRAIVAYLRALQ